MLQGLRVLSMCALAIGLIAASESPMLHAPVVIVYPLTTYGSEDGLAGQRIARLIGEKLGEMGGIEIREPPLGTLRKDYLEAARKLGAEYYLSGFVTVVSGGQLVVEQLASTSSATIVWSKNARVVTDEEVRAQGQLVGAALIDRATRAVAASNGAVLSSGIGTRVARPTPEAAPTPTASPPSTASSTKASVAVLRVGGSSSEDGKAYAGAAIVAAMHARGVDAILSDEPADDLPILGPTICASTGAKLLLGAALVIRTEKDHQFGPWSTAKLDLAGYDCINDRDLGVKSRTAANFGWRWAVDQAASATLKDYTSGNTSAQIQ